MNLKQRCNKSAVMLLLLGGVTVISYCQLEVGNHALHFQELKYIVLNVGTLLVFNTLFYLLSCRWWIACMITGTFWTILSVVNYWVLKYRGLPVSTEDLFNFKTALDVSGSYKLTLNMGIKLCILGYLVILVLIYLLHRLEKGKRITLKKYFLNFLLISILTVPFLYIGYFAENPLKPQRTLTWAAESYYTYGYVATSMEIFLNSIHPVKEPEGYDQNLIREMADELCEDMDEEGTDSAPDIILILNESFYDLNLVSDIETDIPYLNNFNQLDNKISGQTLSVNIGGGTNLSEYELLTSNSMKLLSGVTPFVSLKLKSAKSIVSYLENLGYETMGIHGSDASNYSRARAYPNLGFDHIRFIDDFTKIYNYGKRSVMDQCLYENMHEVEKQMDPQRPHFIFCLTMQNHGDWDMNDSSFDIVQVKGDYGSYTDCINEYLTSIYLSDQAFRGLIDYYSEVDRPTIICMMGDHAPTFVEDIADQNLPELEKGIKMRSTPFVIWANFPIDEQESGDISMIYAVPLLLKTAGLPLSPYYRYLLDMKAQVPIITSFNSFVDKSGQEYHFTDQTPYTELLEKYFYMEYNNISSNSKREERLFEPLRLDVHGKCKQSSK